MLETSIELHNYGKRLRVARAGRGTPVILLHGYPENLQVWSELMPLLAKEHEVISFDWPGLGYSDEWNGGATPLYMAKRLAALMKEWKIEKAHIVGHDMGGQPALVFAAHYPQNVSSVTVMNSLIHGDAQTSWEIKVLRKFRLNRLLLKHFPRLMYARALFTFLPMGKRPAKTVNKDMWSTFRERGVRDFIVRMCAGYEAQLHKLPEWYREVKCPVLICWGENDKHFPVVHAHRLKEEIPHAKMEIIEKGEHWMCIDRAGEIAAKLLKFFRSVPGQ